MSSDDQLPRANMTLATARQELDLIDNQILDLLASRAHITAEVKRAKKNSEESHVLPLRPTREAAIMRRLLENCKKTEVSPELVVRLWRAILVDSSLKQAPITLHVSRHLNSNIGHRLRLRDYFGAMPVEDYRDEAQALMQIDASPGDLCVVETDQPWVEGFLAGHAGAARVIAVLPVIKESDAPSLLLLGHAPVEPSGHDETLVISEGKLPRDFAPQALWQVKIGPHRLSSLPGFLMEHEGPLVGLMRSNPSLKLKIAGQFSSPILVE